MKISITEAKNHLEEIIQSLVDHKEKSIIITKYGKPIVEMNLVNKRIGVMKKEGKDISLEEFNSIPVLDFYN